MKLWSNLDLESRVERRTADLAQANSELLAALENLKLAQGELVRNEKLAALGNLVGGIAHELNTPIGNGVMAVSTLPASTAARASRSFDGLPVWAWCMGVFGRGAASELARVRRRARRDEPSLEEDR